MNFDFTAIDWVIVAIISVSGFMSLTKGLIKEALALGIWVAAFFGSRQFGPQIQYLFEGILTESLYQRIAGFVVVFVVILLLGAVLRWATAALVQATGLTVTDRLLGVLFGVARGLLIVTVAVGLINLTPLRNAQWFTTSTLKPHFIEIAEWSVAKLWDGSQGLTEN